MIAFIFHICRKTGPAGFAAAFLFAAAFQPANAEDVKGKILVEYFHKPGCPECKKVSELVLPLLEEKYHGSYELAKLDTGSVENIARLVDTLDRLGDKSNEAVYMVLDKRRVLAGYKSIERNLFPTLDALLLEDGRKTEAPNGRAADSALLSSLKRKGESFTILAVVAAGLVDGINPCVFSTLVFLASFLVVARVRGRRLLLAGAVYCLASFLSYLALGFGLYQLLAGLSARSTPGVVLNAAMVVLLILFSLLSFRDAVRFHRTRSPASVSLQLPERVKRLMRLVIRRGLSQKYLLPGMFLMGGAVTLLESVCTGQVYVPTLVLLSRHAGVFSAWFSYLLLYNLMFIAPLLLVFAMVYKGTSSMALLEWSRRHVVLSKTLMGVFFLVLAAVLLL